MSHLLYILLSLDFILFTSHPLYVSLSLHVTFTPHMFHCQPWYTLLSLQLSVFTPHKEVYTSSSIHPTLITAHRHFTSYNRHIILCPCTDKSPGPTSLPLRQPLPPTPSQPPSPTPSQPPSPPPPPPSSPSPPPYHQSPITTTSFPNITTITPTTPTLPPPTTTTTTTTQHTITTDPTPRTDVATQ